MPWYILAMSSTRKEQIHSMTLVGISLYSISMGEHVCRMFQFFQLSVTMTTMVLRCFGRRLTNWIQDGGFRFDTTKYYSAVPTLLNTCRPRTKTKPCHERRKWSRNDGIKKKITSVKTKGRYRLVDFCVVLLMNEKECLSSAMLKNND